MKRSVTILLLGAMVSTLFLGCGAAKSAKPIRVGVLTNLTGDKANIGIHEVNGIKMAIDELNAKGGVLGRKLEMYTGDARGNPTDGVNACRRLIGENKVDFIIGAGQSGTNIASTPLANDAKIPLIGTTTTNPKVTVVDGVVQPYSFRLCYIDPYQGKVIAEYAYNELGKKRAAVLYDVGSDYAKGLVQYFDEAFKKLGGEVVAEVAYKTGDVDYRAQLSDIKSKNIDMILLPNNYKDIALAAKQMQDLGMKVTVMMGDSGMSNMLMTMAAKELEGSYITNHYSNGDPAVKAFMERYISIFKPTTTPEPNCMFTYDTLMWVVDAINRAGSVEGPKLKAALEATKDLQLTHCVLTIDPATHNPLKKVVVFEQVKNGEHVFVTKYTPSE
jgi:branched-chain amino acid transport system substrate-binding protein